MAVDVEALLHPDARAELREAVVWYREHSANAIGFVAEITGTLEELSKAPDRWPTLRNVTPPVAHQKRQPLYWTSRS